MSSCMELADKMSCDAMTILAKDQVSRDFHTLTFASAHPACERYMEIADRAKELELQAGNGLAKNLCFDPATWDKSGPWVDQFKIMRPVPERFDASTRPR